ncbi:nucleoside hydrolase [Pseudarthrobacter enclensis]|uniref:Pyrimidine-specific ribonucleoside hydrolase n=1 Tax=Pseudarthrobacter enclensis TaxID=993070 RepID=A0ABT9RWH0_9MICC|nr:nucleoside hydrolase [Pseudarthrobacter enclensis]MDP9888659.1 pyrimidine-specific ribonucleoside hydrolase [Pseudarthrobacter enclensis]
MRHQILLDVDTGRDDALAIMFAVQHPDIDVRAITCVAGNTTLENVVGNTMKILDLVGAPPIPVALGARRPLIEPARDASWIHGEHGLGDVELPVSDRSVERMHAVELMRRCLMEAEEPLTIVALAPMTNLALLLRMHPEVSDRIKRVIFMGGSATIGNATAVAEFNFWHDPEAAHIVLTSGIPLTMYGWDILWGMRTSSEQIAELCASPNPLRQTAGRLLGFKSKDPSDGSVVVYDAIGDAGVLCVMVAPEAFTISRWPVQVVLSPGAARGQTLVDRREMSGEDAVHTPAGPIPVIDVVSDVCESEVLALFFDTLGEK